MATVHRISTTTHGRYVVAAPEGTPVGLLVGFHGYAENAEIHLKALRAIPGSDRWLIVAMQGLHRFYNRDQQVVASWMTREDRELAIADNLEYVITVLSDVVMEHGTSAPLVFAGFSQGGAMAYRAAAACACADGLIILAADVPGDVVARPELSLPRLLLGFGTTDRFYTADKHDADLATLHRLGIEVEDCVFEGGHEWGSAFCAAAGHYLARIAARD